jgi:hypothetical protein
MTLTIRRGSSLGRITLALSGRLRYFEIFEFSFAKFLHTLRLGSLSSQLSPNRAFLQVLQFSLIGSSPYART